MIEIANGGSYCVTMCWLTSSLQSKNFRNGRIFWYFCQDLGFLSNALEKCCVPVKNNCQDLDKKLRRPQETFCLADYVIAIMLLYFTAKFERGHAMVNMHFHVVEPPSMPLNFYQHWRGKWRRDSAVSPEAATTYRSNQKLKGVIDLTCILSFFLKTHFDNMFHFLTQVWQAILVWPRLIGDHSFALSLRISLCNWDFDLKHELGYKLWKQQRH